MLGMFPFDASFLMLDALRRQAGRTAEMMGDGPVETPWHEAARWPAARLRDYGAAPGGRGAPVLVLPAPFKRAYIWDLMPEASAVQAMRRAGLRVFLLEWLPPEGATRGLGLEDYALRLPEDAGAVVAARTGAARMSLAGHSLGGTFAAVFAALRPERVARLALIDAPLAFGRDGGPIAAAVAARPEVVSAGSGLGVVPGSAVNMLSAGAVPEAFVAQRWEDDLASRGSALARAVHRRVMRWTLDEFALPERLFAAIAGELYLRDRFRGGGLELGGERGRLAGLVAPVVAVVNPVGRVVPPGSVLAGLRISGAGERRVLRYRSEPGPVFQHLGPLVGPRAHRVLWPAIADWLARG
jgi:polyhydroxyalkanoate synthase subunit PhaC